MRCSVWVPFGAGYHGKNLNYTGTGERLLPRGYHRLGVITVRNSIFVSGMAWVLA
jgi:hypothetical protein